jgi:hypothetical protein
MGRYLGQEEIEQAIDAYLAQRPGLDLATRQGPSTQLKAQAEDLANQVEDLLAQARRLAEGDPAHVGLLYCLLKQLPVIVFEPLNYVFVGRVVVPLENVMDLLIHLDTYASGQPVQKDGLGQLRSADTADRKGAPVVDAGNPDPDAGYIASLGSFYGALLRDHAGIRSARDLLNRGATSEGRAEIARLTGLGDKLVARWVRRADLMRIAGVDEGLGELIELAGVHSAGELATQDADSLYGRIEAMNAERHIARNLPTIDAVRDWIAQAGILP